MPQRSDEDWAHWVREEHADGTEYWINFPDAAHAIRAELIAEIDSWLESTIGCDYSTPSQDAMHRWVQRHLHQRFKP